MVLHLLPDIDLPRYEPAWVNEARVMHGLAPDASDPEQAKAALRDQRMEARTLGLTIHEMMGLKEVRAVVYRWLGTCRAFAAHDFPYGASIDPLQLARNAAHREVAQAITSDLMAAAPEQYLTMLKEAQSDD